MNSSLLSSSNPSPLLNNSTSTTRRKRKKKVQTHTENLNNKTNAPIEWKSDAQRQLYSSKLLHALRHVRSSSSSSSSSTTSSPRRVRDAAYRVLASTAKGRSRWSRAILTNRPLKLKFMKKNNIAKRQRNVMTVITTGGDSSGSSSTSSRLQKNKSKVSVSRLRSKGLPAVQRKGRVLGRLVPGCRKQPLPVVLEEATDYIAALEMQVRAMSALAELLSVSGSNMGDSSEINQPSSSRAPPS